MRRRSTSSRSSFAFFRTTTTPLLLQATLTIILFVFLNGTTNNHQFFSYSSKTFTIAAADAAAVQGATARRAAIHKNNNNNNKNKAKHSNLLQQKQQRRTAAMMDGIKHSLASALAAGCSKAMLAPFDTIKTMQQDVTTSGAAGKSLMETVRIILQRPGGIWELYAGLGVSVLGSMPSVGLYFGIYAYSKRKLGPWLYRTYGESSVHPHDNDYHFHHANKNNNNNKGSRSRGGGRRRLVLTDRTVNTLTIAVSAAIGNSVAAASRVPYEVVKQRLQTGQYNSAFTAVQALVKADGIKGLFPAGGVSIQMLRDIPYAIFTLLSYEYLRLHWGSGRNDAAAVASRNTNGNMVQQQQQQNTAVAAAAALANHHKKDWWRDMVTGGLSGGIGSYLTNPLDVLKTRLQTHPDLYHGDVWFCAQQTYQEGGLASFLRGSVPRLCHKIPANAFFFLFYELFRRALHVDPHSHPQQRRATASTRTNAGSKSSSSSSSSSASRTASIANKQHHHQQQRIC